MAEWRSSKESAPPSGEQQEATPGRPSPRPLNYDLPSLHFPRPRPPAAAVLPVCTPAARLSARWIPRVSRTTSSSVWSSTASGSGTFLAHLELVGRAGPGGAQLTTSRLFCFALSGSAAFRILRLLTDRLGASGWEETVKDNAARTAWRSSSLSRARLSADPRWSPASSAQPHHRSSPRDGAAEPGKAAGGHVPIGAGCVLLLLRSPSLGADALIACTPPAACRLCPGRHPQRGRGPHP